MVLHSLVVENVAPGRVQGRGGVIVPLGTEEIREFAQIKPKRKLSPWNKLLKQIAESHALDIRMES